MPVDRLALLCCFVLAANAVALKKRNMYTGKLWPKDATTGLVRVPWKMHCSSSITSFATCDVTKAAAYKAAETLSKNTCIRLQYKSTPPTDYIGVIRDTGCWSKVGIRGGRQDLSLAANCEYENTAIHEFMHALGFTHEQNRPDRDNYVTINRANVKLSDDEFEANFGKAENTETLGLAYDYYSVMHYGRDYFSNGGDTITTKDSSKQDVIGNTLTRGPSQLDYDKINKLYGCEDKAIGKQELVSVPGNVGVYLQTANQGMAEANKWAMEAGEDVSNWFSGAAEDIEEFFTEDVADFITEDVGGAIDSGVKEVKKTWNKWFG